MNFEELVLKRLQSNQSSRFYIHLQWFAAEDEGRTEDPTERKIRKAREDGKVAKSSDITAAVVMIFGLITLFFLAGRMLRVTGDMIRSFFTLIPVMGKEKDIYLAMMGNYYLRLIIPFLGICFLAAFLGNVLQVGFLFTTKTITPDFSKIQPNFSRWAQRSFFSSEALFNLSKSIIKVVAIASLSYLNLRRSVPFLINTLHSSPLQTLSLISGIAIRLMLETSVLMLVFAIPDYFFQRRQHRESLKMSKHELKEEFKETEGDPMIKSRLRQKMQEILSTSISRNVPEADVVITNPTHFAVAIRWDNQTMRAPRVTAKGQDNLALRIREIAENNEIRVIENKPLARALHANVEIGDEIPEEYWELLSVILAEVYRLNGKAI